MRQETWDRRSETGHMIQETEDVRQETRDKKQVHWERSYGRDRRLIQLTWDKRQVRGDVRQRRLKLIYHHLPFTSPPPPASDMKFWGQWNRGLLGPARYFTSWQDIVRLSKIVVDENFFQYTAQGSNLLMARIFLPKIWRGSVKIKWRGAANVIARKF